MKLYFKTLRTSNTGLKFTELRNRGEQCREAAKAFLDKYGFKASRQSRISFLGGISSCCDPENTIDTTLWKPSGYGRNEWMPKKTTKEGCTIDRELRALPIVDIDEYNMIIGYEGNGFKSSCIGSSAKNETYYGFISDSEWTAKIPEDCVEITGSEYSSLFS